QARDAETHGEPRPKQATLASEQAPAKSIDHSDHRIEGIEETPLIWDDVRAEPDWRDVKAQLHDERNHIAKVAVLDVERGDQNTDGNDRDEGSEGENR